MKDEMIMMIINMMMIKAIRIYCYYRDSGEMSMMVNTTHTISYRLQSIKPPKKLLFRGLLASSVVQHSESLSPTCKGKITFLKALPSQNSKEPGADWPIGQAAHRPMTPTLRGPRSVLEKTLCHLETLASNHGGKQFLVYFHSILL